MTEAAVPCGATARAADVTGILPTGGSWIIELSIEGRVVFLTTTASPTAGRRKGVVARLLGRAACLRHRRQPALLGADTALLRAEEGVQVVRNA